MATAAVAFSQQAMPTGASRLPDAATVVHAVNVLVGLALVFLGPCWRGSRWTWGCSPTAGGSCSTAGRQAGRAG